MKKHTYIAAVLTVAVELCMDASNAYAQSDRQSGIEQALKLSAEQEKLWAAVEEALTNLREQRRALRSAMTVDGPTDQIERLRRRAELTTQRADALKKLADAVQPLWERRMSRHENDDVGMHHRHHRWRYEGQDRIDWDRRDQGDREWRDYRDRMMGRRGDDDDMRGDRYDRYQRRWSNDDDRLRSRRCDRRRYDFDRRSDRDDCRCYWVRLNL